MYTCPNCEKTYSTSEKCQAHIVKCVSRDDQSVSDYSATSKTEKKRAPKRDKSQRVFTESEQSEPENEYSSLKKLAKEKLKLNAKLTEMQKTIEDNRKEMENIQSFYQQKIDLLKNSSLEEKEKLSKQLNLIREKLDSKSEAVPIKKLEDVIGKLSKKIDEKDNSGHDVIRREYEQQIFALRGQIENEHQVLSRERTNMQQLIESERKKLQGLDTNLTEKNKQIESLSLENNKLVYTLAEKTKQLEFFASEAEKWKNKLEQAETRFNKQLEQKDKSLKEQYGKEMLIFKANYESQIEMQGRNALKNEEKLSQNIGVLTDANQRLQDQNTNLKNAVERLQRNDNSIKTTYLENLNKQEENNKKLIAERDAHIKKMEKVLNDIDREFIQRMGIVHNKLKEAETANNDLTQTNANLTKNIEKLNLENVNALNALRNDYLNRINITEKRYQEQVNDLLVKNKEITTELETIKKLTTI